MASERLQIQERYTFNDLQAAYGVGRLSPAVIRAQLIYGTAEDQGRLPLSAWRFTRGQATELLLRARILGDDSYRHDRWEPGFIRPGYIIRPQPDQTSAFFGWFPAALLKGASTVTSVDKLIEQTHGNCRGFRDREGHYYVVSDSPESILAAGIPWDPHTNSLHIEILPIWQALGAAKLDPEMLIDALAHLVFSCSAIVTPENRAAVEPVITNATNLLKTVRPDWVRECYPGFQEKYEPSEAQQTEAEEESPK